MILQGESTKRLLIRKLVAEDAIGWQDFFVNNPSLDYLGIDFSAGPELSSIEWIEIQLRRYKNNRGGHHTLIDKTTEKLVGQCGLLVQSVEDKEVLEIGYHILPKYWGMGYATEAAQKFRDFAFEKHLSDELVSIIDMRNIASQKVAQKNGMKNTGTVKYYGLDVYIFKITYNNWLNLKR